MRASIADRSWFLGLRWLDTALDFPIDALSSHPKLRPAGALQDPLIPTKPLGQLRHLGGPQPSASSRETLFPSRPNIRIMGLTPTPS
jgi:hypothetical protein